MLGRVPFVGRFLARRRGDFDSADYWSKRYEDGRNSGAGSYGRLAEYKARFINDLVRERGIGPVIEFGSGDGNQAAMFGFPDYTGVDVSRKVVEAARARFGDRPGWRFETVGDFTPEPRGHDLAMSLDVIYHLVEDEVFERYMRDLFAAAGRFVLIYASDHAAGTMSSHVRHRNYSDWVARNEPDFAVVETWDNPYPKTALSSGADTSFAFFRLYGRRQLG